MAGARRKVGPRALGAMLGGLNFISYDQYSSSITHFSVGFTPTQPSFSPIQRPTEGKILKSGMSTDGYVRQNSKASIKRK